MPRMGTLDAVAGFAETPVVRDLMTEAWELKGARTLQVLYEAGGPAVEAELPPAVHPTIPVIAHFVVFDVPESPVGPFRLAELQITCRAGMFPRVLPLSGVCDSDAAIGELAARWGYRLRKGIVKLQRLHDRVNGVVEEGGRTTLDCALIDPGPLGETGVYEQGALRPARVTRDGSEEVRLLQVDPKYEVDRADRGRPDLQIFDAAAWSGEALAPLYPVSAFSSTATVTIPKLRFLVDPNRPATEGTERLT